MINPTFCQVCRHELPAHHPECPVLTGEPQPGIRSEDLAENLCRQMLMGINYGGPLYQLPDYPEQTDGSQIAAEARARCNNLSNSEREKLLNQAMSIIYQDEHPMSVEIRRLEDEYEKLLNSAREAIENKNDEMVQYQEIVSGLRVEIERLKAVEARHERLKERFDSLDGDYAKAIKLITELADAVEDRGDWHLQQLVKRARGGGET